MTQVPKHRVELIARIADRAMAFASQHGLRWKKLDVMMDLESVDSSVGLRLADLLAASDLNFAHDVAGIVANLDRDTGELRNHFSPRYATR